MFRIIVGDLYYAIKCPDTDDTRFSQEYTQYIKKYLSDAMNAIILNDWELINSLIDVNSFVDGYIVDEICKTCDIGFSSFYMYKDAYGKLRRGPIWDYDLSAENCNWAGEDFRRDKLIATDNVWYNNLLKNEKFVGLVRDRLAEKRNEIEQVIDETYNNILSIGTSFERNYEIWDYAHVMNNYKGIDFSRYEWGDHLDYLYNYYKDSLDYISNLYI